MLWPESIMKHFMKLKKNITMFLKQVSKAVKGKYLHVVMHE